MKNKKKSIIELPEKVETFEKLHNKKPVTRRDFLQTGLLGFAASVTLPSFYNVLANAGVAEAEELVCSSAGGSSLAPVVTISLAGGAGLSANFVPHDAGGQPLSSYNKLGLGATNAFAIDREFANQAPFAAGLSGILAGIRTTAAASTLANSVFIGVNVRTRDDSAQNKYNIDGMVAKAGREGSILPTLGRNRNDFSYITPANPLAISSFSNIEGAIGVAGSLSNLSKSQKSRLFKMVERLNTHQARKIASVSGGKELMQLLQCASISNTDLISTNDPGINPVLDAGVAAVWGINANSNTRSQDFVSASIVYNVAKGNSSTGNITLGGYDYHNGTRTSGDTKDTQAGEMIGKTLQTFAAMGQKGFIVVYTDGGVSAPISDVPGAPWTSDNGGAGCAYMIAYNPSGPPSATGFQLGHYTQGQSADEKFITGGSPEVAAAGIFANYMSFSGMLGSVESVIPRVFTAADLEKIIKIA
ncbi:MAG: hypothetical protein KDD61_12965 [Bdellovibrionales bacterium]|nr:hypothetical protein [Bdellovibrionales bacterium]